MHDAGELARLYESGLSGRDVAREMGCNVTTVFRACEEHGVTRRLVGDTDGKAWRKRRGKRRRS